jgi:hypothetical protein
MVAIATLCVTRIRYSRLLIHLVDGDIAGGVEEGRDSSSRCFPGVVDLVQSTRVTCLVSKGSGQLRSSMAMTSARGCWSLGARAQRLPGCHQQRQADSGKVAATAVRSAARSGGGSGR